MNETLDRDMYARRRLVSAVKYLSLAVSLGMFVVYGLIVG